MSIYPNTNIIGNLMVTVNFDGQSAQELKCKEYTTEKHKFVFKQM